MQELTKNEEKEYVKFTKNRPHVVILGAGASIAAIPKGDKNKRPISCMDGFFQNLNLKGLIKGLPLETESNNLEEIFTEIDEKSKCSVLFSNAKQYIEEKVFDYFNSYVIPDEPTIYDYLLLSLRGKDLIASFNWDPLLIQSGRRLIEKGIISYNQMPKAIFLHGNVGAIYEPVSRKVSLHCRYDSKFGQKSTLLFPVKDKDYANDVVIKDSWTMLEEYLRRAYILTIFGYSAPKSDCKAKEILENAWKFHGEKEIEEIEIIDIKDREQLSITWSDFIGNCHFHYAENISMCGLYPRRTTEQLFDVTMLSNWGANDRGFKNGMSFNEIHEFIKPLVLDEVINDEELTNPYRANFNSRSKIHK